MNDDSFSKIKVKRCSKCNLIKAENEFHKDKRRPDGRFVYCKKCVSAIRSEGYKRNKEQIKLKITAYKKANPDKQLEFYARYTADNRAYMQDYLAIHPCVVCGENRAECLEFDHRNPAEKRFDISARVRSSRPETFRTEVAKCQVLCRNCHLRKTSYAQNYWTTHPGVRNERTKPYIFRKQLWLWRFLLEHPCENCDEHDIIVLEFDHIDRNNKVLAVTKMVYRKKLADIQAEVAKCRVLCGNCHRRWTFDQVGWIGRRRPGEER